MKSERPGHACDGIEIHVLHVVAVFLDQLLDALRIELLWNAGRLGHRGGVWIRSTILQERLAIGVEVDGKILEAHKRGSAAVSRA
jgi:hypothetical protein